MSKERDLGFWLWEPQGGWQVRKHLLGVGRVGEEGWRWHKGGKGQAELLLFFQ